MLNLNAKHLKKRELSTMTTLSVAVTRIRAWVSSATTRGTYHYTTTAIKSWIDGIIFEGRHMLNFNAKHLKRELYTIPAIERWIDGIIFEGKHTSNVNVKHLKKGSSLLSVAMTRIRAWVSSATTRGTNNYTITAIEIWIDGIRFVGNHTLNVNVKHLKKGALYSVMP
jgi:hypothetical protein